jgi:hypothetical protein
MAEFNLDEHKKALEAYSASLDIKDAGGAGETEEAMGG